MEYSPAQHLPRAHTEPPRDRYLTLDEIKRLWSACKIEASHSGYILRLLLLTGQRVSEVSKATWDEFDLEHRVWRIPQERSKNKTSHEIYLADGTINILRELHAQRFSKFLFSNTGVTPFSGFSKAKRRVDEASGITNWRQHDLRRTFATHVSQELGVQPIVVDKILNHRSGVARGILGVYQRGEYLKERRDALVCWDTFLRDLIGCDTY